MSNPIPAEAIEAAKREHGEVFALTAADESVLAKIPSRAEYKRFRAKFDDAKSKPDALEGLARDCLVYPDADARERMFARKPALPDVFGAKVLELSGMSGEAESVKL